MKKLLIVLSALVIAVFIAGSVFAMEMYEPEQRAAKLAQEKAAPVKISGEFTFGAITPFDAVKGNIGYANMYADFYIYPDEYNTILIELAGTGATGFADNTISAPYWELSTDVGKALDLPIGLVNTAGKTSLYSSKYEVTGLAYERTLVRSWIDPLSWKFAVDGGAFQVTVALGFGEGIAVEDGDLNDIGFLLVIPEVGPAAVEAWYLVQDNPDYKGKLGFDVKAADLMDGMLGLAGGFMFDMVEDIAGDTHWYYGVGASVKYDPAKIGVSLNGWDEDALYQMGVDANLELNDTFGIDAALGLAFADGADTFQGAEFSVYAKVGAAKWSAGYTITDNAFAYVPSVAGIEGGVFVNADIDF